MVVTIRKVIVVAVLIIAGCAPTPPPVSRQLLDKLPVDPVFQEAESAFKDGRFTEALDHYHQFLHDAYDQPYAEMALFRIASIYQQTGRTQDALTVLDRLKQEFPQSVLIPEVDVAILTLLYDQKAYQSVISKGHGLAEDDAYQTQRTAIFMLLADAYNALGVQLEAARFYYRAWGAAPAGQEEEAWSKIEDIAGQLSPDDLQRLLGEVQDRDLMGMLLYRLGMAYILAEQYDEALEVLQVFVRRFPGHTQYQDAADMILSLEERSRFTPFSVGCLLPLSGPYAVFGQRALNGIELALIHVGDEGQGLPFRIVVKDTQSQEKAATESVEQLDQEKVGVILGPMAVAQAAATAAQSRGVPLFALTQREGIPDIGSYVFRNFITPEMQAQALVSFALEELDVRRFAILYPDENYGRRYMHLFWDQVTALGGMVNGVEAYDPKGTDFAEPIKKIAGLHYPVPKALSAASMPAPAPAISAVLSAPERSHPIRGGDALVRLSGIPLDRDALNAVARRASAREDQWNPQVDFDAIFIPDAPKKAGLVIPQLAYYDIRDVYLLGTNLWNSDTLLKMSGEFMKDALITDGFFANSGADAVQAFVTAYQETYGTVPGIIEAMAYDSAMIVFRTMRQTATDSRRVLKQALLEIDPYAGASGLTTFAPNGEAQKELQVLRLDGGRFVPLDEAGVDP